MAVLMLAACGGGANPSDGAAEKLSIWGWRADEVWVELMESYPNDEIEIEYTSFKAEEYNQILQTGLAGTTGPDVVLLRSYGGLETLVAGGEIAALPEDFEGLKDIPENLIDGARSNEDGNVYGIPFQSVTANIMYNKDEFARLGLAEPTTWAEFIAVCEAIVADGKTPLALGALDSWILPIYRDLFGAAAYDGPAFAESVRDGSADFTSPKYAAANQVLLDLIPYYPANFEGMSYVDANSLFSSGSALMYPGGIWELHAFQEVAEFELGLFNAPRVTGDGEPYAMGYLDGAIGMSSSLEGAQKEAAEDFLKWVGSADFGQKIADDVLSIPAVNGVTPSDPLLNIATVQFSANPTPFLTYVNFDFGTPSGTSLEYDNLQKMMIGQLTPDEVGAAVQSGISQWFTPSNG